jgi:UDP:flavonoid glycosyltransferase YjiC (YdhE family)
LQSLCAQFEARPDCLHLIVVWPNATISANLFGWKNSVVVRTQRALELSMAADLVISAVGYNSFHEILYHRIPAIFIPQMASYMDDQERRARAASDRGLAVTVLADELLVLEREVGAFLDGDKAGEIRQRMGDVSLPDPGNRAAARLIEGVGR